MLIEQTANAHPLAARRSSAGSIEGMDKCKNGGKSDSEFQAQELQCGRGSTLMHACLEPQNPPERCTISSAGEQIIYDESGEPLAQDRTRLGLTRLSHRKEF